MSNDDDDIDKTDEKRKMRREELKRESRELKRQLREAKQTKEEEKTEEIEEEGPLVDFKKERSAYISQMKSFTKGDKRQEETLAMLSAFQARLNLARSSQPTTAEEPENDGDDDRGWMSHTLVATLKEPVLAKDASVENEDTFDIYDPRNPINKRRRQKSGRK